MGVISECWVTLKLMRMYYLAAGMPMPLFTDAENVQMFSLSSLFFLFLFLIHRLGKLLESFILSLNGRCFLAPIILEITFLKKQIYNTDFQITLKQPCNMQGVFNWIDVSLLPSIALGYIVVLLRKYSPSSVYMAWQRQLTQVLEMQLFHSNFSVESQRISYLS